MKRNIEIMAPVGSYEALAAAIQAGAGSVYFGIGKLNMRSRSAKNFTLDDLHQLAETCKEHNVKSYVTVNTIIYDEEMEEMHQLLDAIKANDISAIIASDQSVIQYARKIGVEVHMSTQCNITNLEAVRYYSQFADVMVTARELNIEDYRAELLPQDKVAAVEEFLTAKDPNGKHTLAFVGDGINDAPALMRADVGIAMGALGSDAAIEAADVVLMDDAPSKIATAIRIAKRTMRIVWQNIVFALGVKIAILVLAVFGIANLWLAVFGDVGVAVLAILNAMRALHVEHA